MCLITQTFSVLAANTVSDPTRPSTFKYENGEVPRNQDQQIVVTAILKKGQRFSAIVNGVAVNTGDQVEQWTVTNIDNTAVMLQLTSEPDSQAIQFRVSEKVNVKSQVNDND